MAPFSLSHLFHRQRDEKDLVHVQSGVEHGVTLGTPIGLFVKNEDQRPKDYSETDLYPRPSHADHTYLEKYGIKASSGGGRSSARESIGKSDLPSCMIPFLIRRFEQDVLPLVQSPKSTSNRFTVLKSSHLSRPSARFIYHQMSHRHP